MTLGRLDVREREILAFEQKGLAGGFRQRIGEAISEVKRRPVLAPAKPAPGPARGLGVFEGDRLQTYGRSFHYQIKVRPCGGAGVAVRERLPARKSWLPTCGNGMRQPGRPSHVQLYLDRAGGLVVGGGEGLWNLAERELVRHHPLDVDPA